MRCQHDAREVRGRATAAQELKHRAAPRLGPSAFRQFVRLLKQRIVVLTTATGVKYAARQVTDRSRHRLQQAAVSSNSRLLPLCRDWRPKSVLMDTGLVGLS